MNWIERERKPSALNSIGRVYVAAFYLLVLGVCAVPFALARRQANTLSTARPTPTPRPRPTPAPRPTPRPNSALDSSVAWQNNTVHDGHDANSPLVPPLTLKWSRDLSASGVISISYPLIAQGLVFVTTATSQGETLMALDEQTGTTVWSADVGSNYGFANAAYDSGKVFVVSLDGFTNAYDAASGSLLWSSPLNSCSSPPTAANGMVFTSGCGVGGTLFAFDENNGAVLWMMPVENGDHSSPAVFGGSVFVSYSCPNAYAFNAVTGQQLWHYDVGCEGGGGKTPVVHIGQVYVRDSFFTLQNGIVLDAGTGNKTGEFNSDRSPAFIGNLGVFLQSGTLVGVDISSGQQLWSFAGDGGLQSAPLIVNQTIYIGSSSGTLFGLNTSGQQIWSTQVGAPIPAPDEQNGVLITGLGAGDALLVVPTASVLVAYGN
jgi:outer membrane protein assembly factor BamB